MLLKKYLLQDCTTPKVPRSCMTYINRKKHIIFFKIYACLAVCNNNYTIDDSKRENELCKLPIPAGWDRKLCLRTDENAYTIVEVPI